MKSEVVRAAVLMHDVLVTYKLLNSFKRTLNFFRVNCDMSNSLIHDQQDSSETATRVVPTVICWSLFLSHGVSHAYSSQFRHRENNFMPERRERRSSFTHSTSTKMYQIFLLNSTRYTASSSFRADDLRRLPRAFIPVYGPRAIKNHISPLLSPFTEQVSLRGPHSKG